MEPTGTGWHRLQPCSASRRSSWTFGEVSPVSPEELDAALQADPELTHVAVVHCETTTGILNPLEQLAEVVSRHAPRVHRGCDEQLRRGVPLDAAKLGIDWLISSSNKCIQGVPGFGFVIARRSVLERCSGPLPLAVAGFA